MASRRYDKLLFFRLSRSVSGDAMEAICFYVTVADGV